MRKLAILLILAAAGGAGGTGCTVRLVGAADVYGAASRPPNTALEPPETATTNVDGRRQTAGAPGD